MLHGLGGTPHSVLPVTTAVNGAGFATFAPTLPGHGTSPADLAGHTWSDWVGAVSDAADELSASGNGVVIIGQSVGGTLALYLGATRADVRGVATINALALPADPDATEHLEHLLARGRTMQPAGEPDIRDPAANDSSYTELPLRALLAMSSGATAVHDLLENISAPVLVVSGEHDSVVDPANSDAIAAGVLGPVRRIRLANSAHVASLDFDREQLCRELLTWLVDLTDRSAPAG